MKHSLKKNGSKPLLDPKSQIAECFYIVKGAKYLEKRFVGEGILLGGTHGTNKANVVILGADEASYVTKHTDPIFKYENVIHYCVGNMPGAVQKTATLALTAATMKYALQIANTGKFEDACKMNEVLYSVLNTYNGKMTQKNAADSLYLEFVDPKTLF